MEKAVARGHLDVRLFGHLEVALDGERVALATPRKSLQVLAYLLLHRGIAVSREYLAFLLYPDDAEASARAKLRATLSEIPKILPEAARRSLTIDTDKLLWNRDSGLWVDVEAFAEAAADRARLSEAIEIYRGDLLPEVYDEWLDVIRERLRNVYLRCLSEQVSEARRNANYPLAIEAARKILAVDPWREDVVRRIVAMRYESGDRAGALSEYAAFAKRLCAELGAEPMSETAAVAERIARGEAPGEEERKEEERTDAGPAVLPFVGRRDEMERLLEGWRRVAGGRGACAFVGGEAGIGKSRLVAEFARVVEERGGRVLTGATGSPEAIPYEAVVDALRSALPLVASLRPGIALAGVAALLPELHARVALPTLPRLDAECERMRLFESVFRCLADLAAQRPTLLILEDVHRAQTSSLDLLHFLLRRITGAPVMVLITYRDDETPRLHALHRLRRETRTAGAMSLWLGGLSIADVNELRAATPEIRERNAETLVATTQGNPLFLVQLVADNRDGGSPSATPGTLHEAVARRVERLSEDARTIAEIAACIGDRFSREAVRSISGWEEAALRASFDELFDRRIVREAGGRGVLEYAFTHALVHDAIVAEIPADVAAVRRRRIARVLEELYPERFSEFSATLAAHYEAAGDAANAGRCYLEAVRRTIAIGALEEARALGERALALELSLPVRAAMLLESVTIASRRGDGAARATMLSKLEQVDRELGDAEVHRQALLERVEYAATTADLSEQDRAIAALRAATAESDLRWRAVADLAQGKLDLTRGNLAAAVAAGGASLGSSRASGDRAGEVKALCFLGKVEALRGNLAVAAAHCDAAERTAIDAGDASLEMLALASGWILAYQRRDVERCRFIADRCITLASKLGDRTAEAHAFGRLGISYGSSDAHVGTARENFAAAARIYAESGDRNAAAAQHMNASVLEARIGFFDRAFAACELALSLFERAGDERGRLGALANGVFVKAYTGDLEGARALARASLEDAKRQGFELIAASILENLASAEGAAGNYPRAIELAEASFAIRARSDSQRWSAKTLAEVAIWHLLVGNQEAALSAIGRLRGDAKAMEYGSDWPAYCYWAIAQVMRRCGQSKEAVKALDRANHLMHVSAADLDAPDRAAFLRLQFHRDIAQAVTAGIWPDPPR